MGDCHVPFYIHADGVNPSLVSKVMYPQVAPVSRLIPALKTSPIAGRVAVSLSLIGFHKYWIVWLFG